MNSNIL
jgi:outer membrane biosynthesis protein TonB